MRNFSQLSTSLLFYITKQSISNSELVQVFIYTKEVPPKKKEHEILVFIEIKVILLMQTTNLLMVAFFSISVLFLIANWKHNLFLFFVRENELHNPLIRMHFCYGKKLT